METRQDRGSIPRASTLGFIYTHNTQATPLPIASTPSSLHSLIQGATPVNLVSYFAITIPVAGELEE